MQISESPGSAPRTNGDGARRVIGASAYFEAMGVPRTPADLEAHQAVVYEQRMGGTEWTFRRGSAEISVTVDGRVRVGLIAEDRDQNAIILSITGHR